MFNLSTGEVVQTLPSLNTSRMNAAAWATGGAIFVAGGTGENDVDLRSVEVLEMGDYTWRELPTARLPPGSCHVRAAGV